MKVTVSFDNVDRSKALEQFVMEKSEKLSKFLKENEQLNWVISFHDKLFDPVLRIGINGKKWYLHTRGLNPYTSVQNLFKKAYRVLNERKFKEKVKMHL